MQNILFDEQKQLELGMLVYIKEICEQHNISYSLCGGSLIGAIRHKGFIPWDDDIDIFLTRDNYNHLINVLKSETRYKLYTPGVTPHYIYGFSKLINPQTIMYNDQEIKLDMPEMGVFIDIFPIDSIPEGKETLMFKKARQYTRRAIASSKVGYYYSSTPWKMYIKRILYYPEHLICRRKQAEYWMKQLEQMVQQYNNQETKYCGSIYSKYGEKEIFPQGFFDKTTTAVFENIIFSVIKNYDVYLKTMYGDYMELPPEKERTLPHDYKAYWRK